MYKKHIEDLRALRARASGYFVAIDAAIALMRAAEQILLLCEEAKEAGDVRVDVDLVLSELRDAIEASKK